MSSAQDFLLLMKNTSNSSPTSERPLFTHFWTIEPNTIWIGIEILLFSKYHKAKRLCLLLTARRPSMRILSITFWQQNKSRVFLKFLLLLSLARWLIIQMPTCHMQMITLSLESDKNPQDQTISLHPWVQMKTPETSILDRIKEITMESEVICKVLGQK